MKEKIIPVCKFCRSENVYKAARWNVKEQKWIVDENHSGSCGNSFCSDTETVLEWFKKGK